LCIERLLVRKNTPKNLNRKLEPLNSIEEIGVTSIVKESGLSFNQETKSSIKLLKHEPFSYDEIIYM